MIAEKILLTLINLLLNYLEDLKDYKNIETDQFQYGEKVAYTECLEYLQLWENTAANGLDFNIEEKYPL